MPSNDPYALLAGVAYAPDRNVNNQIPAPTDWYLLSQSLNDNPSGFKAYTFGNASSVSSKRWLAAGIWL